MTENFHSHASRFHDDCKDLREYSEFLLFVPKDFRSFYLNNLDVKILKLQKSIENMRAKVFE